MRCLFTVSVVLLLVVSGVSLQLSDGSEAFSSTLLISEVDPFGEGFTILNAGYSDVDLKGFTVTDGEGKLRFGSTFILGSHDSRTFVTTRGSDWFTSRAGVILYGEEGTVRSGSLKLADSSDELLLSDPYENTIDSVCYGSSSGVDMWNGPPVPISSGRYLMRTSYADTDSASDWISTKPGWTNRPCDLDLRFDAEVTPFTFPESKGYPVYRAVSESVSSVDISIYLLSSPNMVALLVDALGRGVTVRILIEANPLGTNTSTELALMKSVHDAGGEVRVINSGENTRYTYVHNKYAVIDGDTVVVTSENWTSSNLGENGNRGWGVVVKGAGYAGYMESVFSNDFSTAYGDVRPLMELYPNLSSYSELRYVEPEPCDTQTYAATVTPVVSPDNSFLSLEQFVNGAERRVYAEQMDLGSNLATVSGDTPLSWMAEKASEGLEVRFILDSSTSTAEHQGYVDKINITSGIKALAVNGREGFSLIHNKGVIVDDAVWVGSVNWTSNSFQKNRETAVIIRSDAVSDYFAGYFMADYGVTMDIVRENGLSLKADVVYTGSGTFVVLSAVGPDGSRYVWDLGNGVGKTTSLSETVFRSPGNGTYTARVTLEGTDVSETLEYHVDVHRDGTLIWISGAAALISFTGFLVAVRRERSVRECRRPRHPSRGHRSRRRRFRRFL